MTVIDNITTLLVPFFWETLVLLLLLAFRIFWIRLHLSTIEVLTSKNAVNKWLNVSWNLDKRIQCYLLCDRDCIPGPKEMFNSQPGPALSPATSLKENGERKIFSLPYAFQG